MRISRRAFLVGSASATAAFADGWPVAAGAAARPIVHGVAVASFDAMLAFEAAAGRYVRSHTYFRSLGAPDLNPAWEAQYAARHLSRGTTPVLTLQPQDPRFGVAQPAFAHPRIIAGDHDAALTALATALASVPGPVIVRAMHEGNGNWYPWCAGVNGNTTTSYVAAWRHVVELFRRAGATNVQWLWSMNKLYPGSTALAALYPGDDVVDQVGFSGYNGGTALARGGWRTFADIFDPSFSALAAVSAKPRYVTETGCVEQGGDKAAWITAMWAWMQSHPDIAGITWFDMVKDADWRVGTSTASLQAYRRGALAAVASR